MSKKRNMRSDAIFCAVIVVFLLVLWVRDAYSRDTCGATDAEIQLYLESKTAKEIKVLKTEEKGRVKAAIYEREDMGLCISFFDRKMFGLRWKHTSMNMLPDDGLSMSGRWSRVRCDVAVYGDNRDGGVESYRLDDAVDISRDHLESDFILDIYILDGIKQLPDRDKLVQQKR